MDRAFPTPIGHRFKDSRRTNLLRLLMSRRRTPRGILLAAAQIHMHQFDAVLVAPAASAAQSTKYISDEALADPTRGSNLIRSSGLIPQEHLQLPGRPHEETGFSKLDVDREVFLDTEIVSDRRAYHESHPICRYFESLI